MHKTSIGFNEINDHYFKEIEHISIKTKNRTEKIKCFYLRFIIFLKNIFCELGFLKHSIGEVILFKKKPISKVLNKMKKYNWKYKSLPKNPYL